MDLAHCLCTIPPAQHHVAAHADGSHYAVTSSCFLFNWHATRDGLVSVADMTRVPGDSHPPPPLVWFQMSTATTWPSRAFQRRSCIVNAQTYSRWHAHWPPCTTGMREREVPERVRLCPLSTVVGTVPLPAAGFVLLHMGKFVTRVTLPANTGQQDNKRGPWHSPNPV